MKKLFLHILVYLVLLLLPLGIFSAAGESVPDRRQNAFTAVLNDKYRLLGSVPGPRIVFIGGSSLPFGLKSARIEEAFGRPVIDFGVYASLGTKVMAELALPLLCEGDLVVLAPETDAQTYSLYFNAGVLWEAGSEERGMFRHLEWPEKTELFYHYFGWLADRIRLSGSEDIPEGTLYARSSFDRFGDLAYPREGNLMPGGFDASQPVTLEGLQNDAFFDWIEAWTARAEAKGARVFFSFSPVNAAAVRFSAQEASDLEAYIDSRLPGKRLGLLADFTYEPELFYNTNYHLNDAGARIHTEKLIGLLAEAGPLPAPVPPGPPPSLEPSSASETVPDASAPAETLPYDPNAEGFVIEEIGGFLYVTGLKDAWKDRTELTLPAAFAGRPVSGLGAYALSGSRAEHLVIPGCYRMFDLFVFAGCPQLARIDLGLTDPGASSVPLNGLFDGASPQLKVYVPSGTYTAYSSDYNWRSYRSFLVETP